MSSSFFSLTKLPAAEWDFYWNRAYLPDSIKLNALRGILAEYKLRSFSREFAMSRLIFFHGPPGCGKTTIAKGICNHAARELSDEQCFFSALNFNKLRSQD